MRQIVLDTETTGLEVKNNHRIIEIGCVEIIDREISKKTFHHYLNPERAIDASAIAVHGLTQEFLQDKPLFKDIAQEFLEFVQGSELIIHNATFDVGFINNELKNLKASKVKLEKYCKIFDTLVLAREKHPGQKNNLDALCKRYGVDMTQRNFHGALLDAHLLAQVYLAMTGGQKKLFEEKPHAEVMNIETSFKSKTTYTQYAIKVLLATSEELELHQKYVARFKIENKDW